MFHSGLGYKKNVAPALSPLILPPHPGISCCHGITCPVERSTWQGTERGPTPRTCEELGPPAQQLVRK